MTPCQKDGGQNRRSEGVWATSRRGGFDPNDRKYSHKLEDELKPVSPVHDARGLHGLILLVSMARIRD
jgi:hypothetical protein